MPLIILIIEAYLNEHFPGYFIQLSVLDNECYWIYESTTGVIIVGVKPATKQITDYKNCCSTMCDSDTEMLKQIHILLNTYQENLNVTIS